MDNPNAGETRRIDPATLSPFDAALTLVMRALSDGAKAFRSRALHSLALVRRPRSMSGLWR